MKFASQKLFKKAKKFPDNPGVYWFSANSERIYVGRATSLKKRILSYFRNPKDPRITEMVDAAANVSFRKTNNLLEAVILEANLIKKYLPKYNVKEKDDRSFLYLVIPKEKFPRPFIARAREVEKFSAGGNAIFGPFQSYQVVKDVLSLARRIFPFSVCRPNQNRPCFDYQIGLCPGVCAGAISEKDYKENIKNLILFFKGEHKRLFKKLKKENPKAFFALKNVEDVALIKKERTDSDFQNIGRIEGYDISHLSGTEPVGAMVVFKNGEADNSEYRLFRIKKSENNFDDPAMLGEILERRFNHEEWPKPDVVLVDGGRNQISKATKILAGKNIFIPVVGIAKTAGHSASAASSDRLFFANSKPSVKKLLASSKKTLQQVRNEAHRFAISFQRRRRGVK